MVTEELMQPSGRFLMR